MKEVDEEKPESLEEAHPLLKRALQQPPQPFNMGGVTGFQDEVYKPHKKFRHGGRKDSDEPTSTQESLHSPSPGPSHALSHSILASQLAAPPTYTKPGLVQPGLGLSQSLLATTLSRPVAIPMAKEESKRNELLANLILDSGRYRQSESQSLLMCAVAPSTAHNIPSQEPAGSPRWRGASTTVPHPPPRHIPVPVAPTQPTSSIQIHPPNPATTTRPGQPIHSPRSTTETSKPSHLKMGLSGLQSSDSQPLNLSTRTPPPHDIPTEA